MSSVWRPATIAAIFLSAGLTTAVAQDSWDRYQRGTLESVIQRHDSSVRANAVRGHPNWVISAQDFATRASVIYVGQSRPTDSIRVRLIQFWLRSAQLDTSDVKNFSQEYLFREGSRELWIPVQNQVAAFFPKELSPGQPITAYVMWLGAYYDGGDVTWGFILNEFDVQAAVR